MENNLVKLRYALDILPQELSEPIRKMPQLERERIQEIRLRADKFLTVTLFGNEYYLSPEGKTQKEPLVSVTVSSENIDTVIKRAFRFSMHSFSRELSRGYITIDGGCRVGFCGTAVLDKDKDYATESVKNISSVNIRVARELLGCSTEIFNRIFSEKPASLLLIGPPSSGKTTVLRDLCRKLGDKYSVCIIDERNEIAATQSGKTCNDIGRLSDVFNSYNKFDGIMTAVRVMSPKIIAVDEIGSKEDQTALQYACNSGVKLIATTHATDYDDAKRKSVISKLIKDKVFDYACVLGTGSLCGKIIRVVRITND